MLLFGKQMSIRRLFPLMNQVDYMLVEGREWVTDSEKRYTAFETNEALITGIPRLISQIMVVHKWSTEIISKQVFPSEGKGILDKIFFLSYMK